MSDDALADLKHAAEVWADSLDWPGPVVITEPIAQLDILPDDSRRAILTLRFEVAIKTDRA